ncbi:hypothetical protein NRK67_04235 [Fusobacteria bacterium ZRK30]|nr:hypothetical protein NRK67_04235 [Fusobacteria bacterium ZRK30]
MKKRIAILALIAISNLANAQLNENQNEFIKVNQNNLLNDEERFQENKILVFGNFNFYNKNSRHSNNFKRKGSVKPPITPEVDLSRPIEDYEPLRPEKDPSRPIEDYEPLRPERDPLRPIEDFEPITPERDPLRPIEDFEPITPEIPVIPIMIWEDGKEIRGTSYTLTHDITTTERNDGLKTKGGEIINEATITMGNEFSFGMTVEDGGSGVNNGTINASNGVKASEGGTLINNGLISLTEVNTSKSGMQAYTLGEVINEESGNIAINANGGTWSYGIRTFENTSAINKGNITVNGDYGKGMHAKNKGNIVNKKVINIDNDGDGMIANYESTAINKGTININGDYGIGIEVTKGATGINDDLGIINLNANNGIGIKVDGVGSSYVNNGDINIASETTGNQEIVLSGGATFSNSGSIVADGEFNTNQMGNGQFIMSDGGSLEADKIKGDIYASGALAMGGYDDIYSTYKMLKTTNLEGDIISNSAMFDAHFTENKGENGFYDVVLDRKDFNTIVSNDQLGEILENNYEDNGDKFKEDYYDALKLVTTEKGLNKAAKDSYGMSYYPTLAKQTFEIINDSNQVIVNNVIDNVKYREVDETIAPGDKRVVKDKEKGWGNKDNLKLI